MTRPGEERRNVRHVGLAVINPGLFATVQDLGRPGFRARGVPPGGAFDRESAALANALLGNGPGCAVIELTVRGGVFEARVPLALAVSGAMGADVLAPGSPIFSVPPPSSFSLSAGDRLVFQAARRGVRAYLAVLGGWLTPQVLGSRSSETPLRAGDLIPCRPGWTPVRRLHDGVPEMPGPDGVTVRVVDGPDAPTLASPWPDEGSLYRVGVRSDRMGLRLEGPRLYVRPGPERLSAPVSFGAVQVAGGQPLVLGVACGTMGGYPHVAHVISADLDRLARAGPGDPLRFVRVSLVEARGLDREARADRAVLLAKVRAAAGDRGGFAGLDAVD